MNIGIIGCGNMGGGMARQLLATEYKLICYDPDVKTLEALRTAGAGTAANAGALAKASQVIILSLPKAAVVETVMREILSDIQPDTIILDTSTSEPATSQALASLGTEHGFTFIDGPVSGGPAAANAGSMSIAGMDLVMAEPAVLHQYLCASELEYVEAENGYALSSPELTANTLLRFISA